MDTIDTRSASYSVFAEYFTGGKWTPLSAPVTFVTPLSLRKRKLSTDTGMFIPGVYRVNAYEVCKEEVTNGVGSIQILATYYGTRYRVTYTGCIDAALLSTSPALSVPAAVTLLQNETLQKAYSKLGKAEFGIGEDLGELRETIQMLRSPFKSLREFFAGKSKDGTTNFDRLWDLLVYNRAQNFRSMSGARAAKAASDTWLEFRYGFRPLVGSIGKVVEAIQAVDDKNFDPNTIRSCRSRKTKSTVDKTTGTIPSWPGGGNGSITTETEWIVRASVQYRQSRPYSMIKRLGLTPSSWPETAWELTKLSFVVDWLVSIGPWIETFRFKPEITVLGNTVGTKCSMISSTHNITMISGYGDAATPTPVPPMSTRRRTWYKRDVGVKPPNLPVFRCGDVFDIWKTIDSVTLILQRLKTLKK